MAHRTSISVFEMLKVGIGPSSSHTLGPWRAAEHFVRDLAASGRLQRTTSVRVELFGSLAKTGRGHGTGIATMMGLSGHDPETCDVGLIQRLGPDVLASGLLTLNAGRAGGTDDRRDSGTDDRRDGGRAVPFVRERDIVFEVGRTLPAHPNAMRFTALLDDGESVEQTSYSIGGGFVVHDGDATDVAVAVGSDAEPTQPPCPIDTAADLERWCTTGDRSIADVVRDNERTWRSDAEIDSGLLRIRDVMIECMFRGCSISGTLPGGLEVTRRAAGIHERLMGPATRFASAAEWFGEVCRMSVDFDQTVKLVSCCALAVNEENAAFGRVVTAPTNGAAGVIPAVMLHHLASLDPAGLDGTSIDDQAIRFLLVAAEVGAIFKKRSTISAAMGGCQAEIGVSSAMAAAALTECRGGSVRQSLMAAEIAMEHHLGLTCDPIGGLVQVPCIERNVMGAMKAISASHLAMSGAPELARVSLDDVIDTMWATAQDMSSKYKETAEGGLATRIPVNVVEC